MNRVIKTFIFAIILSIALVITITTSYTTKEDNTDAESAESESTILCLKLNGNKLLLLSNNIVVKNYDINTSVLPSEDIYLLSQGIIVEDVGEADMVAENFDG